MKILIISAYPPQKDGIGDYSQRLADSLKANGQKVSVLAHAISEDIAPSDINVARIIKASLGSLRQSFEYITQSKPDVIHLQYCIAVYGVKSIILLLLLRKVGRKYPAIRRVVTLHEAQREDNKLGIVSRLYYRLFLRYFDGIIVHLDSSRDMLVSKYGIKNSKITVVAHPIIDYKIKSSKQTIKQINQKYDLHNKSVVLCFGFIQTDKGIDHLIRSLPIANRKYGYDQDLRVVIAGTIRSRSGIFKVFGHLDKLYLKKINKYINKENLNDQVIFTGYVKNEDVSSWFSRADIICLPYTSIEQSGVFNIALSAKRPIVATNVGGLGDTLRHTGIVVEPACSNQLADAFNDILCSPALASKLVKSYGDLYKVRCQSTITRETIDTYRRAGKNSV